MQCRLERLSTRHELRIWHDKHEQLDYRLRYGKRWAVNISERIIRFPFSVPPDRNKFEQQWNATK